MALALHYQGTGVRPNLPLSEARLITDLDVLPGDLVNQVAGVDRLDVHEPLSFPFEDLPDSAWAIPLTIHLPQQSQAGDDLQSLVAMFDTPVFSRLTILDAVSASDIVWRGLQERYGWPNWMRVSPGTVSTSSEVYDAQVIESRRVERGRSHYDNFSIRTAESKERLSAVCEVIHRNIQQARRLLYRQATIQIHGCNTSAFIPSLWSELAAVFEYSAGGRKLLQQHFPNPPFSLVNTRSLRNGSSATGRHIQSTGTESTGTESTDIVVGIGNLQQSKRQAISRAFDTMFSNLRVGGTLVICERLNGKYGPNDMLELLLDASNHNLVMDDVETVRVPSDPTHGYAVIKFSKLGSPKQ